jgi:hypothetical protein
VGCRVGLDVAEIKKSKISAPAWNLTLVIWLVA